MSKSERAIHKLISEASILSDFGIPNEEILQETGVSKRTLLYSLKKIRYNEKVIDTRFGKFIYHKFES